MLLTMVSTTAPGLSLGTSRLVNNWREQSQQAWQGKQRRLSPFSQGLLSHNCHPFLLQKKEQNSMKSQRPYLSLFVILRKGSVMALIYFVLFLQSFVLLLKSNALHESFRSKESVRGALTKHMFVHLETWRSAEIALKPGNIV